MWGRNAGSATEHRRTRPVNTGSACVRACVCVCVCAEHSRSTSKHGQCTHYPRSRPVFSDVNKTTRFKTKARPRPKDTRPRPRLNITAHVHGYQPTSPANRTVRRVLHGCFVFTARKHEKWTEQPGSVCVNLK